MSRGVPRSSRFWPFCGLTSWARRRLASIRCAREPPSNTYPVCLHALRNFLRSLPCKPFASACAEQDFETAVLPVAEVVVVALCMVVLAVMPGAIGLAAMGATAGRAVVVVVMEAALAGAVTVVWVVAVWAEAVPASASAPIEARMAKRMVVSR